jgi:hypothetical protein
VCLTGVKVEPARVLHKEQLGGGGRLAWWECPEPAGGAEPGQSNQGNVQQFPSFRAGRKQTRAGRYTVLFVGSEEKTAPLKSDVF